MTGPDDTTPVDVPFHPNVPKRRSVVLAFVGVLLAGWLGGTIGWGLVDATCSERPLHVQELLRSVPGFEVHTSSCDLQLMGGALGGAILGAVGAAVIAVLVLRAQSEWKAHPPGTRPRPPARS
jgi:hypothetical protein